MNDRKKSLLNERELTGTGPGQLGIDGVVPKRAQWSQVGFVRSGAGPRSVMLKFGLLSGAGSGQEQKWSVLRGCSDRQLGGPAGHLPQRSSALSGGQ